MGYSGFPWHCSEYSLWHINPERLAALTAVHTLCLLNDALLCCDQLHPHCWLQQASRRMNIYWAVHRKHNALSFQITMKKMRGLPVLILSHFNHSFSSSCGALKECNLLDPGWDTSFQAVHNQLCDAWLCYFLITKLAQWGIRLNWSLEPFWIISFQLRDNLETSSVVSKLPTELPFIFRCCWEGHLKPWNSKWNSHEEWFPQFDASDFLKAGLDKKAVTQKIKVLVGYVIEMSGRFLLAFLPFHTWWDLSTTIWTDPKGSLGRGGQGHRKQEEALALWTVEAYTRWGWACSQEISS